MLCQILNKQKKMFRQRIILWLIITLGLSGVILFVNQQLVIGAILLTGALSVAIVYIYTVTVRVKAFSELHLAARTYSVGNFLTQVKISLSQHHNETKQIIDVIGKIGSSE